MDRILVLCGSANSGKTTTLKQVIRMLEISFSICDIEHRIESEYDERVIFDVNGKKVGIETQGDPSSRLRESIPLFVNLNCDLIVCATRTRGQTVKTVIEHASSHDIISWRSQSCLSRTEQREPSNNSIAQLIVKEVLGLCGA
ncbi:MAG: hypothetical protein HRT55_18660 [Colwellia sp.]|uniref:hypothetical protein n=1 Tax=Alteromonadales TaxID=135622 RepID=UPI001D24E79C|nr:MULTISPECIES: hypothetical protein [Alteromonadales]NQZ28324.1 hypothetical protein [Colwellia sp.]NRA81616.1 hypothetical protein [Pseudoalteromonas sp.]